MHNNSTKFKYGKQEKGKSFSFKNDHIYHGTMIMDRRRKFKTDQPSENQESYLEIQDWQAYS